MKNEIVLLFCHSHAPLWIGSEASEDQVPVSAVPVFVIPLLVVSITPEKEGLLGILFPIPVLVLPESDTTEPLFVSLVFVLPESVAPVPP